MGDKRLARKPVLIVQHTPFEHAGLIRRALETLGVSIHVLHPYLGEPYPRQEEIRGIISLGGVMGANDIVEHPWIGTECTLLRRCTEAGLPVVGICLGGQMLARSLGAEVSKNEIPEVGWHGLSLSEEGKKDPILSILHDRSMVYQWHYDTFKTPAGATHLAHNKACYNQAYRLGERAYGFQFHPEVDVPLIVEWLSEPEIEQELYAHQDQHGAANIQTALEQRRHAELGESSSLKLSTGIAQLFSSPPMSPETHSVAAQLDDFIGTGVEVELTYLDALDNSVQRQGIISRQLSLPMGRYLVLKDTLGQLWPVRLDLLRIRRLSST